MNNYNLYHYCRRNCTEKAVNILEKSKDLDVFYEDGILFKFAISKENVEICNSLLKYFNNIQFPEKNKSYEEAKDQLVDILENAVDSIEISLEMQQVLSPYISFDNSLEDRSNVSIFEDTNLIIENEFKYTPIKKSHSTGDLSNSTSTSGNSKEKLLLTEDNLKRFSSNFSGEKTQFIEKFFVEQVNHNFQTNKIEDSHVIGETQSDDF